jgi:hypothetical protein
MYVITTLVWNCLLDKNQVHYNLTHRALCEELTVATSETAQICLRNNTFMTLSLVERMDPATIYRFVYRCIYSAEPTAYICSYLYSQVSVTVALCNIMKGLGQDGVLLKYY